MNAKDLMHGDLVMYGGGVCMFVIDARGAYLKRLSDGSQFPPCAALEAQPIPLTEGILKKIGAVMYKKDWSAQHWLLRGPGGVLELLFEEGEQSLRQIGVGGLDVDINYVHELQHILRICGMTDLANNFRL